MGLGKIIRKVAKSGAGLALKASPVGRIASVANLARKAVSGAKRVAAAGIYSSPSVMSAVNRAMGRKRKKRKGLTDKEMANLLKLQMFVSKKSIPYQLAVMKAMK